MNKLLMLAFLVVLMGLVATAGPQEEGGKVDLEDAVESREAREAQSDLIPGKSKKQKAAKKSKKQKANHIPRHPYLKKANHIPRHPYHFPH